MRQRVMLVMPMLKVGFLKTSACAKFAVNCISDIRSFGWRFDRQKVVTDLQVTRSCSKPEAQIVQILHILG